jgi:mRNA interferase MazF
MNCGDVLLIQFPFTNTTGSKVRPAIVISTDQYNSAEDRVFVPISSVPAPSDPHVYSIKRSHRAFNGSGLKQDSWVKWAKPTALSIKIVQRRLGKLDAITLSEIGQRVRSVFPDLAAP